MQYANRVFHNTKKGMDLLPILQENSSWFPHGFTFQQTAILQSSPSEHLPISSPVTGPQPQRDESSSVPFDPVSLRSVLRLLLILLLSFFFGFSDNILYIFFRIYHHNIHFNTIALPKHSDFLPTLRQNLVWISWSLAHACCVLHLYHYLIIRMTLMV